MEIIRQLGLVIGFGYAGELAALFLPVRIPAGVLGIIFVFAALSLGLVRPRHFGATAGFISANMAFFFLPLAAAILQNYPAIRPMIIRVTLVCVLSTLITFAVSYGTVRFFRVIMGKGESLPRAAGEGRAGGGGEAAAAEPPPGDMAGPSPVPARTPGRMDS
jgi:holin-like protein